MKKHEYIILLLLILALFYHYQQSQQPPKLPVVKPTIVEPVEPIKPVEPDINNNNCDLLLQSALKSDKKLLIIFSAEWCGYCRSLKKDLPSLDTTGYEICSIDVDDESKKELIKHFNVKIIPTSIMIDPISNKEIKRISGYISDNYKIWLKE